MEFAKNLMKKYGWNEGDGLGRDSDGIKTPIKANLKFDTAGFGVDRAQEFNDHWWETIFNEAASNLKVENSEKEVIVKAKSDKKKLLKKGKYSSFVKSPLNAENAIVAAEPIASVQLTDEELFVACGGRTAHKGARHGLRLTGKLQRIQKQETLLKKLITTKVKKDTLLKNRNQKTKKNSS